MSRTELGVCVALTAAWLTGWTIYGAMVLLAAITPVHVCLGIVCIGR
jgi:hypothetical protein